MPTGFSPGFHQQRCATWWGNSPSAESSTINQPLLFKFHGGNFLACRRNSSAWAGFNRPCSLAASRWGRPLSFGPTLRSEQADQLAARSRNPGGTCPGRSSSRVPGSAHTAISHPVPRYRAPSVPCRAESTAGHGWTGFAEQDDSRPGRSLSSPPWVGPSCWLATVLSGRCGPSLPRPGTGPIYHRRGPFADSNRMGLARKPGTGCVPSRSSQGSTHNGISRGSRAVGALPASGCLLLLARLPELARTLPA